MGLLRELVDLAAAVTDWADCIDGVGQRCEDRDPGQPRHLPTGTRLMLGKERPRPGAQLRSTDIDGMRVTAFITDTAPGAAPGQLAGPEQHDLQHARAEDSIRYRVLHVAARITNVARQLRLRIDATWRWAGAIATAWQRIAPPSLDRQTSPDYDQPERPRPQERPPTPATRDSQTCPSSKKATNQHLSDQGAVKTQRHAKSRLMPNRHWKRVP